jgi:iron complex transport system ATP-binding protein
MKTVTSNDRTADLVLHDISVKRGGNRVLEGIDVCFSPGELAALIGPNGAGKSTLLGSIAGTLPFGGSVLHGGETVNSDDVSYLPQAHGVTTTLSVLEIMLLGRLETLKWRARNQDLDLATRVLAQFAIGDLAWRAMNTLSGGQQQIVLLAQRLMRSPQIVILDEPTSALDLHHQLSVLAILRTYARSANAIVITAIHDIGLAGRQCDRVVLLDSGRLRAFGPPPDVLTKANLSAVYRVEIDVYRNERGHEICVPITAIKDPVLPVQ